MGILFGYSEVGFRVLLGGKLTIARHVAVIETDTKCTGFVENSFDKENDDIEDNDLLVNMNKE